MASEGPNSPDTCSDDATVGTITWVNPGDAISSNDFRATAALVNSTSHYLKAVDFDFAIPSGATIKGIVVEIERAKQFSGVVVDSNVRIVKGGAIGSTNKASGTSWPVLGSEAYATYGSSSDLWGETWTDTDINATDFGAVIAAVASGTATANIDHVRITVHYTAAAGGGGAIFGGRAFGRGRIFGGSAFAC